MGLGMQLVGWHEDFVACWSERGFSVIRFDNRDIGLSQGFEARGVPNLALDALRHALGLRVKSPYTLADMAADTVGVLDALGIGSAHVVRRVDGRHDRAAHRGARSGARQEPDADDDRRAARASCRARR